MKHLRTPTLLILSLIVLMANACRSTRSGDSGLDIAGGTQDWGHPAAGELWKGGQGFCTATLIGASTVLTAAHCTLMAQPGDISFKVGGKEYQAFKFIRHPGFNQLANDIALIILKSPVKNVEPAALATWKPWKGQTITIVGYGLMEDGKDPNHKRYATTTIAAVEEMSFSFKGPRNTRKGDSGGPTFTKENGKEVVAGVHSSYEESSDTGVDMAVSAYKKWIVANMESGAGKVEEKLTVGNIDISPIASDYYTIKGKPKLSIKATSGAGITQVSFLLQCDNSYMFFLKGEAEGSDKYAASWDTTKPVPGGTLKPSGTCTIKAMVYDNSGGNLDKERKVTVKN